MGEKAYLLTEDDLRVYKHLLYVKDIAFDEFGDDVFSAACDELEKFLTEREYVEPTCDGCVWKDIRTHRECWTCSRQYADRYEEEKHEV